MAMWIEHEQRPAMSFIFTHLIVGWIAGKSFELIAKKKLSSYTWLFLLAGTIIPDLDFLIDWTLKTDIHRTITHSLTFAILFPLFVYITLKLTGRKELIKDQELTRKEKLIGDQKNKYFCLALAVGLLTHPLMDMQSHLGVAFLWPSPVTFSYKGLSLIDHSIPSLFNSPFEQTVYFLKKVLFDVSLGAAWLFYLGLRKRIKF